MWKAPDRNSAIALLVPLVDHTYAYFTSRQLGGDAVWHCLPIFTYVDVKFAAEEMVVRWTEVQVLHEALIRKFAGSSVFFHVCRPVVRPYILARSWR